MGRLSIKRHTRKNHLEVSLSFPLPPSDIPRSPTNPPTLPIPLPLPTLSLTPASPDSSCDFNHSPSLSSTELAGQFSNSGSSIAIDEEGEADAYWRWRDEGGGRRSGEGLADPEKRWEVLRQEAEARSNRGRRRYCSLGFRDVEHSTSTKSKLWLLRIAAVLVLLGTGIGLAVGLSKPNQPVDYEPGTLITSIDPSGFEHTITTRFSKMHSGPLKVVPAPKTKDAGSGGVPPKLAMNSPTASPVTGAAKRAKTTSASTNFKSVHVDDDAAATRMRRRMTRRAIAFGEAKRMRRRYRRQQGS